MDENTVTNLFSPESLGFLLGLVVGATSFLGGVWVADFARDLGVRWPAIFVVGFVAGSGPFLLRRTLSSRGVFDAVEERWPNECGQMSVYPLWLPAVFGTTTVVYVVALIALRLMTPPLAVGVASLSILVLTTLIWGLPNPDRDRLVDERGKVQMTDVFMGLVIIVAFVITAPVWFWAVEMVSGVADPFSRLLLQLTLPLFALAMIVSVGMSARRGI